MVEPTKVKPRFCRSLLMASDSGVRAGRCFNDLQEFTRGFPSTNCHAYWSNEAYSSWIFRNALAFATAEPIFSRLRTMPSFFSRVVIFRRSEERRVGKECRSRWVWDH